MYPRKTIAWLALRFVVVLGLLSFGWPGVGNAMADYFRWFGRQVIPAKDGLRVVLFEKLGHVRGQKPDDLRISVVNLSLLDANGYGPVRDIPWPARAFIQRPLALLIALLVATPVSWRKRALALVIGSVAIHAFLWGAISFVIWKESAAPILSLATIPSYLQEPVEALSAALIAQVSIAVPVLSWLIGAVPFAHRPVVELGYAMPKDTKCLCP